MELRHLEYFVAVADDRNFTRAAANLHVVQSAVSAGIKTLEQELGVLLLDRNSKRVHLTNAGAAFLPLARATLEAAQEARDVVVGIHGGLLGSVRIGSMISVGIIELPALLGEFHRRHPDVMVQTTSSGSNGLIEALTSRQLDLAFVSLPGSPPPGIDLAELAYSELELVVPIDHPLAGQSSVAISDLAGLDFIDSPPGYGNRSVVDRAFVDANISRHVTIEIADIAAGVSYVLEGLGVALLPRFAIGKVDGIATLRVIGADLKWPLSLATPAGRKPSPATRALIALIPDHIRGDLATLEGQ
jgi:DNA-binding transcriptional LysR family regulator